MQWYQSQPNYLLEEAVSLVSCYNRGKMSRETPQTHMESHSETPSQLAPNLLHVSSSLNLPRRSSSNIEHLVEYTTIPSDAVVEQAVPPLLSSYNLYRRRGTFTRGIRSLISTSGSPVKEYVQSSRLDQCDLASTKQEQYVTIEIPPQFIST